MDEIEKIVEQVRASIDEGKSDEEIFPSLEPFLGQNPTFDERLAESLARLADGTTAKILQRMLNISKEKRVQKMIKRSLYRLKSKGISVGDSPQKEPSILRPLQAEPPRGMGGAFDALGQRFLVLVLPRSGRGGAVMDGIISDTQGLVNFYGQEMTRKGIRIFLEEIQEKSPLPVVEMEASYVAFLFAQAYRMTLERKGTVPQDYPHLKGEIEKLRKDYERPLIYNYLPAEEIAEEDWLLKRGKELLKTDLFSSWRIEEDLIRRYADEVREADESKIVLHPTQKEARFQAIYQKALSDLFSGERRLLYKGRLEEMAYVLFKLGKEEEARVSLAVALDLEKPLNLLQPNPFLLQMVTQSIFFLLAEADEQTEREPSLIIKP